MVAPYLSSILTRVPHLPSILKCKLLKLNAGWLKEGDEWPVKKLPAAWRSPGVNAEKLEERMRSLQGYFQTFAEWATRLRSRP